MGITKTDGFTKEINQTADILKVLGHPARLAIIEHLAKSPSCICNDIVDEIPLAQPTISRHLSELKRVGLIQGTIEGKNVCYCINDNVWKSFLEGLNDISKTIVLNKKCC